MSRADEPVSTTHASRNVVSWSRSAVMTFDQPGTAVISSSSRWRAPSSVRVTLWVATTMRRRSWAVRPSQAAWNTSLGSAPAASSDATARVSSFTVASEGQLALRAGAGYASRFSPK